jgi:hypothetical protein
MLIALRKEIRAKEMKLGIRSIEATIERFELDVLKAQLEMNRLEEELGRSRTTLLEKQEELDKLLKEN